MVKALTATGGVLDAVVMRFSCLNFLAHLRESLVPLVAARWKIRLDEGGG